MHPLLGVSSFDLRLHESPELAVEYSPASPVALALPHLQNYLHTLGVECVHVYPNTLIEHGVECLERVLVSLFLTQPVLLSPVAFGRPVCVFLHGSGAHTQRGRVVRVPPQFLLTKDCVQPGKTIDQGSAVWRQVLVLTALGFSHTQTHQETLRTQADEKLQQIFL